MESTDIRISTYEFTTNRRRRAILGTGCPQPCLRRSPSESHILIGVLASRAGPHFNKKGNNGRIVCVWRMEVQNAERIQVAERGGTTQMYVKHRQAGSDIRHGRRRGDPHRVEVEVVVLRGQIDRLEVISIRRSTGEKRERK